MGDLPLIERDHRTIQGEKGDGFCRAGSRSAVLARDAEDSDSAPRCKEI